MLAHELRNPLAPISAAAAILKTSPLDVRVVERTSDVIGRQVAHMTGLVDDLLDVSRVTNASTVIKVEPLDFGGVVDSALEQVQPKIAAKNHRLDVPQLDH